MFPTVFVNSASKVQYNTLNLRPLWRSVRVWALITANFTNHTGFPAHQSFNSDSNWLRFALKLSVVNKASFSKDQRVGTHQISRELYVHVHKYATALTKTMHFTFIFIRISISSHQSDHSSCYSSYAQERKTRFLLHNILIYIHTHTNHYFQCTISPSNYRKIHCPLCL